MNNKVKVLLIITIVGIIFIPTITYLLTCTNGRYKFWQSDEEICIRWRQGVDICSKDKEYRKNVVNIIKNGGCLTSVPDMGQMWRTWEYCKETSEKIDILYLPTGEIFNFIEEGEFGRTFSTPLSDEEYKKEIGDNESSKVNKQELKTISFDEYLDSTTKYGDLNKTKLDSNGNATYRGKIVLTGKGVPLNSKNAYTTQELKVMFMLEGVTPREGCDPEDTLTNGTLGCYMQNPDEPENDETGYIIFDNGE